MCGCVVTPTTALTATSLAGACQELLRERGGLRSHHEYVMEAAVQLQEVCVSPCGVSNHASLCRVAQARTILMTTYIYGYYLPPEVHRDLFEFLQADLEQAVEVRAVRGWEGGHLRTPPACVCTRAAAVPSPRGQGQGVGRP